MIIIYLFVKTCKVWIKDICIIHSIRHQLGERREGGREGRREREGGRRERGGRGGRKGGREGRREGREGRREGRRERVKEGGRAGGEEE